MPSPTGRDNPWDLRLVAGMMKVSDAEETNQPLNRYSPHTPPKYRYQYPIPGNAAKLEGGMEFVFQKRRRKEWQL